MTRESFRFVYMSVKGVNYGVIIVSWHESEKHFIYIIHSDGKIIFISSIYNIYFMLKLTYFTTFS